MSSPNNSSLHLDILARSVKLTVGEHAEARPGQVSLCEQVYDAMAHSTHASSQGPVGLGKSYSLLAAAAARCVEADERVLISTESLSLQKQILDKDAPIVVRATADATGRELVVAVLKGTGNYVDPRQMMSTVALLTGVEDKKRPLSEWVSLVQKAKAPADPSALDNADFGMLRALVMWALIQYDDPHAPADRHSCNLTFTEAEWSLVSAGADTAADAESHWLFPKALVAKELVGVADIVIVNHTLLAIQAARGLPIVSGNSRYGVFHHVLVDEAHALPDEVRKQGASEVSGKVIHQLVRAVRKVATGTTSWERDGETLADALERQLRQELGRETQRAVGKEDDPLGDLGVAITGWARRAARFVKPAAESTDVRTMVAGKRAQARVDELCAAVTAVSEHHVGEARWVEGATAPSPSHQGAAPSANNSFGRSWTSAQSSPVDVSMKLQRNLWTREPQPGWDDIEVTDRDEEPPVIALGVAGVSATLPPGFPYQVGLRAQTIEYPSPFTDAYARSALLIPSGADPVTQRALLTDGQYGARFDTKKHVPWASARSVELIGANEGSALLLSATSQAGREYTRALRAALPDLTIYSQWDGGTPARLVGSWRDDHSSVLVGTRSFMTGIDVKGESNSMVILDRIPRKPANPVDDARVEELVARAGIDRYAAVRMVYAADAALLEAQATGRLIRAQSDIGLAAVLDPRLLKYGNKAFPGYDELTRQVYMKPLYVFGQRFTDTREACSWVRARKLALTARAA